jgi:hypothetical protein
MPSWPEGVEEIEIYCDHTGDAQKVSFLMNKLLQVITVLFLILLTGCVVGRRTVDLPVQSFSNSPEGKGEIFIGSIEDNRVFQNKPSDPSIPSIDGNVHSLTPKEKGMMIGRQRSGYGRAMGDVALPADDSVIERTRRLLEEGFRSRGYRIASDSSAQNSASATIDEFWAWFSPGFWSISFEARVYCTIKLTKSDGSSTIVVKGYGINKGQIASDANWQLAYQRAFQDFLSKLDSKLAEAGY